MTAFQVPLLKYALSVSNLNELDGFIQIISLQVLQFCLLAMLLFLMSAISVFVAKLVAAALLICNAVGLYFMISYGMDIDRSMIANIFNTDIRETTGLLHISIVPYVLFLGLLPALLILLVRVRAPRRIWRLVCAVGSIAVLVLWIVSTSFLSLIHI